MRAPLRAFAAAHHGAFTTSHALSCYTRAEVRSRVRSGRWRQVFHGVYRHRDSVPTARLRLAAAALTIGRPVTACLNTAAELHGFGVLDDTVTHVAVRPGLACLHRPGLWPHQLALGPDSLVGLRCGRLATSPARTAVDLARILPRLDVLPILDSALASGACTPASLAAELDLAHRLPGVTQARELVPLADARAESPQESRLRLHCHDAGLPRPTVQLPVLDGAGRTRRWLDLGWRKVKVGLEYDSEEAHAGRKHLRSDRRRHNFLQNDDWMMFYAVDLDIYRNHATLMQQVADAIARRSR